MKKRQAKKTVSFLGSRPPVVAVVGHIDHGKTTLLDKIRQSRIASREPGGITQHIGASQIEFRAKDGSVRKITFIDTPGHAAFTKMRARGVEATDLVVLVIAADAGIQEQTKESLDHIKAAGTPFLVAINKIDLANNNIDQVKEELVEIGVVPEEYGGDVVVVPVSAKTGEGIENLLEMICLMADLQSLKADLNAELKGVVIESALDRQRGVVATVLVKDGRIKLTDEIFAEAVGGKVKAMRNWLGELVTEALPGDAVEVLGFEAVPPVGAAVAKKPQPIKAKKGDIDREETGKEKLKLVFKADTRGTLEAILNALPADVKIIHAGVGQLTDSDIFLAQTAGAQVFAFDVKISPAARKIIAQEKIDIFQTKIIYEFLEEVEKRLVGGIDPLAGVKILGKAKIVAEFKVKGKRIAGARVLEGEIARGGKVYLMREEKIVGEGITSSMKERQKNIDKAVGGQEFGVVFSPQLDFAPGDVIISYKNGTADKERRTDPEN